MKILRAQPEDWSGVRDLRLRALLDAPDAFGSTYTQEAGEREERWRAWATGWSDAGDQALFAAVDDGEWIGIALGVRWRPDRELVNLYAMWVDPSARGQGVGQALVEAVTGWARDLKVRRMGLRVTEGNPGALALYEDAGSPIPASANRSARDRRSASW